jgi:hypothetical protein
MRTLLSLVVGVWLAGQGTSGVTGVLKDEAGRPLAGAKVLACMRKVCLVGETSARGRFTFQIDTPADVVIKTEGDLESTPRRAVAMRPVQLTGARVVNVGSVYVPTLPAGQTFGGAGAPPDTWPLEVGDGLTLTVSRRLLRPAAGFAIVDVAARRIPLARVPRYPVLGKERVIAVYALHPFAATSVMPIAVRIRSRLPPGTRVKFRTIDEIDGTFSEPIAGASTGRYLVTDPATGIHRLTYLVISR